MDGSQQPCIIQALPATINQDKESPAPPNMVRERHGKRESWKPTPRLQTSRCTRSQAAPDWSVHETLILISHVAALDEAWLRSLSSYQKWKIVSDNCAVSHVARSSNQCKRKWESLLSDYRNIRAWQSKSGDGSYWRLEGDEMKRYGLPALFDHQVFEAMDAVIRPQEARMGFGDSDSEDVVEAAKAEEKEACRKNEKNVVEAQDVPSDLGDSSLGDVVEASVIEMLDVDTDLGSEKQTHNINGKNPDKAKEMAKKLEETAQRVHTILRGDIADNAVRAHVLVDMMKPTAAEIEFTRQQADELLKALGGLAGTLDQFTRMIRDGGSESIRPTSPVSL